MDQTPARVLITIGLVKKAINDLKEYVRNQETRRLYGNTEVVKKVIAKYEAVLRLK